MNSSRFDLLAVIFFSKLLNFCSLAVRFSCFLFLAINDKNDPFLYMHYFLDLFRVGLNIVCMKYKTDISLGHWLYMELSGLVLDCGAD